MRVLSVEDNCVNQTLLSTIVQQWGAEVVPAAHGLEALQCLEQASDFDLIFMDLSMPVMDGHEAIARIRQDQRFDHIPIVVVTASLSNVCNDCTLFQKFISKPFRKNEILEVLDYYANGPKTVQIERHCLRDRANSP